ncbi:MAG: PEGA domain-containing protein [Patescibacteria group bacterium]
MGRNRNWPTILGYSIAFTVFVVVAIIVLSYATGYRLNFKTGQIEKTGVLAITTKPSGASVLVSGKKYTRKTPLVIRNILPGDYVVEVNYEGYQKYLDTATIKPGFATELQALDLVLEQPKETKLAEDVANAWQANNEVFYRNSEKLWYRVASGAPIELTFERIPAHLRDALLRATNVNWMMKHENSSNWAINITVDGKKWLAVVDPNGYRGALFSAPLNQADEADITFVDSDRLVGLVNGTLYTLDLNSNKLVTYQKDVTGFSWYDNKGYFTSKSANGKPAVTVDNNLFDGSLGEALVWNMPTGQNLRVIANTNDWWLLATSTGNSQVLWLLTKDEEGIFSKQTRIAGDLDGYAYDKTKERIHFITGNKLVEYDFKEMVEKDLRDFGNTNPQLLARRDNTLFIKTVGDIAAVSLSGSNVYNFASSKDVVLFDDSSRRVWVLRDNVITSLELRAATSIFGGLVRIGG